MIRLEKINGKNVWDALKLKVSDEQKKFVASNEISVIEAYTEMDMLSLLSYIMMMCQ